MTMKAQAVVFLKALGFTEVRARPGDSIECAVAETLKVARRKLKAQGMKFPVVETMTLPNGIRERRYVVKGREVVGELILTSHLTHSTIELKG